MSNDLSEYSLDDKLSTIRNAIHRLTLNSIEKHADIEESPIGKKNKDRLEYCICPGSFGYLREEIDPTESVVFQPINRLEYNKLLAKIDDLQRCLEEKERYQKEIQNELYEYVKKCENQSKEIEILKEKLSRKDRRQPLSTISPNENLPGFDCNDTPEHFPKIEVFVREIMKELNVSSPKLIISEISALKQNYGLSNSEKKFISKLSNLILQFSPPGAFEGKPPVPTMWKWIRNVVEDYAKMKIINKKQ